MDIKTAQAHLNKLTGTNVKVEPIDCVEVLVEEGKDIQANIHKNQYRQLLNTIEMEDPMSDYLSYATFRNNLYECNECTFKCAQKFLLRKHVKTHIKPYRCDKCDYRAASMNSLQKHLISHMAEKPYKCPQCSYTGSRKLYLDVHMRTHYNSSFKCSACEYTASHRSTLTKHFNVAHLLLSE